MADVKIKNVKEYQAQLEQVKNRLADIQKLEDKGFQSAISKKETQKEIVELQKKIQSELAAQNRTAKTYQKIIKDAEKTEQNISKTVSSRISDVLKGNIAGALNFKNIQKSSLAQTAVAEKTKDFAHAGLHYVTLVGEGDSYEFRCKCKEIYIYNTVSAAQHGDGAGTGAFELYAELTHVSANEMYELTGSGITTA